MPYHASGRAVMLPARSAFNAEPSLPTTRPTVPRWEEDSCHDFGGRSNTMIERDLISAIHGNHIDIARQYKVIGAI
jgi:hypothetical protein